MSGAAPARMASLLALAMPLALALPVAARAQEDATPRAGTFRVGGQTVAAEHGAIEVPSNRSSGSDATLTLRFVRFPSTSERPAPPIVFLAGGPGDAATRAVSGMPRELLDTLRALADVIAFDQRGTGTSEPAMPFCPPGAARPLDRPGDPEATLRELRERLAACLAGAGGRGIDVLGFTTLESADDLEALRRSLGTPSLQLLAGSYGTHLALAYARRYPGAVESMVLVGVEGPDHTFELPSHIDSVVARIAAARRPGLTGELRALRDRLAAEPVGATLDGDVRVVVGAWDLQRWVAGSLDRRSSIDALLDAMPRLLAGDFEPLARASLADRRPRPIHLMNLATDCASWASPDRLERMRAEASRALVGDVTDFPKPALCDAAGLPRLEDAFREPVRATARALLVAGTFDGRTPLENAIEVAAGLPNAELLVIEEAAHDLMGHPRVMARALELFAPAR